MSCILFLTQVLPYPLDAGPKVRGYYMLRHLAINHEVTLVSFVRPDDKPEYVDHLRSIVHAVYTLPMRRSLALNLSAAAKGLLSGLPMFVERDEMPEMAALLRRLVSETPFDLIHADQLSMASYGLVAAQASPCRPATLLDEHNAIYQLTARMASEAGGLRRAVTNREARAFRHYEAGMMRAYDALLTVTEEDRQLLLALFDDPERGQLATKFTVVPICIDPERVKPVAEMMSDEYEMMNTETAPDFTVIPPHSSLITPHSALHTPTILHLGTMFWPPNVSGVLWFAARGPAADLGQATRGPLRNCRQKPTPRDTGIGSRLAHPGRGLRRRPAALSPKR